MARVTVEDCIEIIPNRFELVITAAQRAKQISSGVPLTIDRDNDKDSVVSLREIADKTIDLNGIQEEIVQSFQKQQKPDPMEALEQESRHFNPNTTNPMDDMEAAFARVAREKGVGDFQQEADDAYAGSLSFIEENVEVDD